MFYDPAITGIMPAAAIAFRRGHISPARTSYCLKLSPAQLFETMLSRPHNTATIRTSIQQSRLTIGMPVVKELPWLKPSETSGDVTVVTDPDHDHIPAGAAVVRSDTGGEPPPHWTEGVQTIDTPRTQAVSGWIGGKALGLVGCELPVQDEEGRGLAFEASTTNRFLRPIHPDHGRRTGPPKPGN